MADDDKTNVDVEYQEITDTPEAEKRDNANKIVIGSDIEDGDNKPNEEVLGTQNGETVNHTTSEQKNENKPSPGF